MDMINTPTLSQSIGQDNVGNIISALIDIYLLSKEKDYNGALLCIDEVEVSLHPDTQLRLLNLFKQLADELSIQFVLSTHSLTFLKEMIRLAKNDDEAYSVVYLKNPSMPSVMSDISYDMLKADLFNKLSYNCPKPKIYFEDEIGEKIFHLLNITFETLIREREQNKLEFRNADNSALCERVDENLIRLKILRGIEGKIKPIVTKLGCENLLKISGADDYFKRVIFMLDGDARIKDSQQKPKICKYLSGESKLTLNERKHTPNICFLPTAFAPESYMYRIIYTILSNRFDSIDFWESLDQREDTALYTSSKISAMFNKLPESFNNDDLKKCFNDDLWDFIEKSNILTYYYADYKTIEELMTYLEKLKDAYNMTFPLTVSNRYA